MAHVHEALEQTAWSHHLVVNHFDTPSGYCNLGDDA
jgi:hypothetical protein